MSRVIVKASLLCEVECWPDQSKTHILRRCMLRRDNDVEMDIDILGATI